MRTNLACPALPVHPSISVKSNLSLSHPTPQRKKTGSSPSMASQHSQHEHDSPMPTGRVLGERQPAGSAQPRPNHPTTLGQPAPSPSLPQKSVIISIIIIILSRHRPQGVSYSSQGTRRGKVWREEKNQRFFFGWPSVHVRKLATSRISSPSDSPDPLPLFGGVCLVKMEMYVIDELPAGLAFPAFCGEISARVVPERKRNGRIRRRLNDLREIKTRTERERRKARRVLCCRRHGVEGAGKSKRRSCVSRARLAQNGADYAQLGRMGREPS